MGRAKRRRGAEDAPRGRKGALWGLEGSGGVVCEGVGGWGWERGRDEDGGGGGGGEGKGNKEEV